jgi:hypothetical protein
MQPAMLGGGNLAGRALDQRPQVFAGEPTDLDAPTLGLCVELRPVGDTSGRPVEEPLSRQRGTVVHVGPRLGGHHAAPVSPIQVTPITG